MSENDDPLADLLGSMKRHRRAAKTEDLDFSRASKPEDEKGLNPLDLLGMPALQRDLINTLSRQQQATFQDIVEKLDKPPQEIESVIDALKAAGYLREALIDGQIFYRVVFGGKVSRSGRGVPQTIWNAVDLDNTVFLQQLPLFSFLSEEDRREIALEMQPRRFQRNEVIVWQGDISDSIYFIKNGVVGMSRLLPGQSGEETRNLAYLRQGGLLGIHNLLTDRVYPAATTATALSEVDVLELKRAKLLDFLLNYDHAALALARMLAQQLVDANTRLTDSGTEKRLSLVFGVGICGATTIGSALAMTLARMTQSKTVFTEHPYPERLPEQFGFQRTGEIYQHPAGFDIALTEGTPGLPENVRTTLVLDQLSNNYTNVIIGLPGKADESVSYMLKKAHQIVVVTPPDPEAWQKTNALLADIRAYVHPERTNIQIVANRKRAEHAEMALAGQADLEIPYLPDHNPRGKHDLDQLALPLQRAASILAERLGRTNQIGIYIPTTVDVDQEVDTSGYIQETLTFLGELFGGASTTTNEARGVWNSEDAGLVSETIHIVRTLVSQIELDKHLEDVLKYMDRLKRELKQEAMALEVNQKLMLI
ncbi:MAG: cyclic nucleotide-binding domain-containing protein [Chloroflexi bacterium]|nr:cyclic nucleotide-binding domain-containing protein [Chloroflexota bacterium]